CVGGLKLEVEAGQCPLRGRPSGQRDIVQVAVPVESARPGQEDDPPRTGMRRQVATRRIEHGESGVLLIHHPQIVVRSPEQGGWLLELSGPTALSAERAHMPTLAIED